MKTCSVDICNNPQFGGGFCKYHQYMRKMQGGDQHKRKPRKESKKREKDNRTYRQKLTDWWANLVETNQNYCYFCMEKMNEREDNHHLSGRNNGLLLDDGWWVPAHRECHMNWHSKPYEWLSKQTWWSGYLLRLKAKDETLYNRALRKGDKAQPLNPKLWDDDE